MKQVFKSYAPEMLEKLHKTQIQILSDFQTVCDKYGFQYFVVFGTALGAVRHKGFIPWDDDIDVGMMRDDYEKFLQVAENELSEHYQIMSTLKDERHAVAVTKLQRKGTQFISHISKDLKSDQFIFLDIFPYDYLAPTDQLAKKQVNAATFWDRLLYLCGNPSPVIPMEGAVGALAGFVCKMTHYGLKLFHVSPKKVYLKFEKECTRYHQQKGDYVTCFGAPTAWKERIPVKEMFPCEKVDFEGIQVNVLKNNKDYLTKVYGDYMQLPPEDKRINHCPYLIQFEGEAPMIDTES